MNILLLIKNFDFGGAENHVCGLANSLSLHGHKVILVSGEGRQFQKLNKDVKHIVMLFSDLNTIINVFRLWRLLKKEHIDVIHGHQRLPILAASFASLITKIPLVATVHGKIRYDLKSDFVKKKITKAIAICENSLVGLQRDVLLKHKSVYIPNGVDFPEKSISTSTNVVSFYYISRLDYRHTEVIKFLIANIWPAILRDHPEARFCIVGDGKYFKSLRLFLQSTDIKHLADSIDLVGYESDLAKHYEKASLVLGVGRVALESISFGIPVLSIKINRLGEIINLRNIDYFQFGNFVDINGSKPDAGLIIKMIDDFIKNRDDYKKEAILVQQRIRQDSDIQNVIFQIMELYQEVLINNHEN